MLYPAVGHGSKTKSTGSAESALDAQCAIEYSTLYSTEDEGVTGIFSINRVAVPFA